MLDAFGPLDMLSLLQQDHDVDISTASMKACAVTANGLHCELTPDLDAEHVSEVDLLIVPGGRGVRRDINDEAVLNAVRRLVSLSTTVLTVCTGSALLAKAGCLDGLKATSNKRAFEWVQEQGPSVHWESSARWVVDDKFYTSSGVSAGMDCILGWMETKYGAEVVSSVCHRSEYIRNPDPKNDPFKFNPAI